MDKLEKLKRLIIRANGGESFSTSYTSEEVFVLYINSRIASNLFLKNDKITIDVGYDGTTTLTVLDKTLGPTSLGYVAKKEIKLYIEAMYRLKFNNYIEKADTIYIDIDDTP